MRRMELEKKLKTKLLRKVVTKKRQIAKKLLKKVEAKQRLSQMKKLLLKKESEVGFKIPNPNLGL